MEKYKIENLDVTKITSKDILKIAQLEQDMRSREEWFWEYVECVSCGKIHSKENMFWQLSNQIRHELICEIEKIIPIDSMNCQYCHGKVEAIFDPKKSMEKIKERYEKMYRSYVTILRDNSWEIRGFFDGFVDKYWKIYNYEFQRYYDKIWKDFVQNEAEKIINTSGFLLTIHGSGIEESVKNLFLLFEMQKSFFSSVQKDFDTIDAIYEVKIGTSVSVINALFWWVSLNITQSPENRELLTHTNFRREIYAHPNIADVFFQHLQQPIKQILRQNREAFRNISIK